jgi:hypothetical protein
VDSNQASESSPPQPDLGTHRRFARTLSRARWPEYGRVLKAALGAGYRVIALEEFLDGAAQGVEEPLLILRHDVDQCSSAALTMSAIERDLGLRSTWYFRWRTADAEVIAEVRRRDGEVGLHYETLSREALETGGPGGERSAGQLAGARRRLREEIATFAELHGPIRSVAAHGDTRAPGVRNGDLLRDEQWSDYGIEYDANDAMRRHRLAAWLTDRSDADGGWSDGRDPFAMLAQRQTPILFLTHPNNWVSGATLWWDRLTAAPIGGRRDRPPASPSPAFGTRPRDSRTRPRRVR